MFPSKQLYSSQRVFFFLQGLGTDLEFLELDIAQGSNSTVFVRKTPSVHIYCAPVFSQVADAMKRMHERQNIGKVILLPEPKKVEEKPKSNPEPEENVEKTDAAVDEKKEEAKEEVKAEKD